VRETAKEQEKTLNHARESQAAFDQKMTNLRGNVHGLRARLNSWHRELGQLHTRRERVSREMAVSEERQRSLEERQLNLKTNQSQINEELALYEQRLETAAQETARLQAEADLQNSTQQLAQYQGQVARETARQEELQTRLSNLQASLDGVDRQIKQAEADVVAAERAAGQVSEAVGTAEQKVADAQADLAGHLEKTQTQDDARKKLLEEQARLNAEGARLQAQIEVLEQAENALAGFGGGARALLQASQQGSLKGALGALSTRLDVPEEYETAIAAVLGEYIDAILLQPGASADEALSILKDSDNRATLLVLDQLSPEGPEPIAEDGDILGMAASLVNVSPELRPVVDLLLGNVLITRSREAAQKWVRGAARLRRAVTLSGEVYRTDGIIVAGKPGNAGTIGRSRQKRELSEKLAEIQKTLTAASQTQAQLEAELEKLQNQSSQFQINIQTALAELDTARANQRQSQERLEQATRQRNWQQSQRAGFEVDITKAQSSLAELTKSNEGLHTRIETAQETIREQREKLSGLVVDELQADVAHWSTLAAVAERAVSDAASRRQEREQSLSQAKERGENFAERLNELTRELQELQAEREKLQVEQREIGEQISALQTLIDPAEKELAESEGEQDSLQDAETKARQVLTIAERRHAQAQIGLARKQEALDTLRSKIEDDFGLVSFEYSEEVPVTAPLPFGDMVETLPLVTELSPEIGETIKVQRTQLRRMGAINPEAQKEYNDVEERYRFLIAQIEDSEKAEANILEIIAELDILMEREFRKTFDEVAREFRGAFTRLFGGGSAKLVLTDPEDLTNTGVDIEAQLPGRRMQGLSLLSGGERSLTASALVFSLLKVSPTPFCVMDEVDAMLDEANVNRFAGLLRELSEKTQFVIITHNRNTVQIADTIYGITMGRDSTSQALGLRLDEVADVVKE
jgi:chromosome segregation protein